jgi:hypothetical protein
VVSKSLEDRQRKILNSFDPNRDEVKRALPESKGEKQP